jgi:hypothetical protein
MSRTLARHTVGEYNKRMYVVKPFDWNPDALPPEVRERLPPELRDVPAGKYALYPSLPLTREEEEAVQEGLDELDRGEFVDGEEVMRELRERYRK